jgi:hypothetical protein
MLGTQKGKLVEFECMGYNNNIVRIAVVIPHTNSSLRIRLVSLFIALQYIVAQNADSPADFYPSGYLKKEKKELAATYSPGL